MREDLKLYIENNIIPRYSEFDKAHSIQHVNRVIKESLILAEANGADIEKSFVIAAYHDVGMLEGREYHHLYSADILRHDTRLLNWFSAEDVELMAQAVEDHRASALNAPRTIYGAIVAEADRDIDLDIIVRRTIQYGIKNYSDIKDFEFHFKRAIDHIYKKYGEDGYIKLPLSSKRNEEGLREVREMLKDFEKFRTLCLKIWNEEHV